ncbi:MAG: carbon-nitrogen hydrolase family protein [Alphaproteobacteria bacterium]|nr:carbon-nitrogen hydrolase family protein [Alphaproteobacteria bacterium]
MSKLTAACIQLRSSDDAQQNTLIASDLIRQAQARGARLIATPENTCLMAPDGGAKLAMSETEERDPSLPKFCDLAHELKIWLLIGSLAIRLPGGKTANRSYLIDPSGRIAARYDKIHLFDVDLPSGETYRESNTVEPGDHLVTAETDFGRLGLTICYDLRFPQLYRALAKAGAEIISVPSAFTQTTGEAHWHVLLRARAIETGAFILAPAQGGRHANGRETFGHSLIIDPWGAILAEGGTEPGIILAELDLGKVAAVRARIPALRHDRPFT